MNNHKEKKINKIPITVRNHKIRIVILLIISVFLLIYLGINIYKIQVLNYEGYKDYAKGDHEKVESKEPYRGEIRDRKGNLIVSKEISFRVSIIPFYYNRDNSDDKEDKIYELASILVGDYYVTKDDNTTKTTNIKIDEVYHQLIDKIKEANKKISRNKINRYDPLTIKEHINEYTAIELYEKADRYPWITVTPSPKREYKLEEAYAHIIGFTSPIFKSEKEQLLSNDRLYIPTSKIGRSGLEKIYDLNLRGKIGKTAALRNSLGRSLGKERVLIPTTHGNDLYLTIDSKIQKTAYLALGNFKGSVIVSKPSTGEILAMVSSPSYDPNTYYENYRDLYSDEDSPLLNRAISGIYPVGSIFKIIVASAALELGLVNKNNYYNCKGYEVIGYDHKVFKCTHVHGKVNLKEAIQVSCNAYFYNLALKIGWDNIYKYGKKFGLGELTGIDLENEIKGYFVNEEWKIENTSMPKWLPGDTANGAIGQGFTAVTPIQIHNIISAVVNDGYLYKPHLVKKIIDINNDTLIYEREKNQYLMSSEQIISKKTADFLKEALRNVVELKGGTARRARSSIIAPIAGKTGTVEVSDDKKDHALFTGFAPYGSKNTEDIIAITVVAENAGYGGVVAVPIATAIFRYIFEGTSIEKSYADMHVPYIPPENEFKKQLSNTYLVDNINNQNINQEIMLSSIQTVTVNQNINTNINTSNINKNELNKEILNSKEVIPDKQDDKDHTDEIKQNEEKETLLTSNQFNDNKTVLNEKETIKNDINKIKEKDKASNNHNNTNQSEKNIEKNKLALEEDIKESDIQNKMIKDREKLKEEQEKLIESESKNKENIEKEIDKVIEKSGKDESVYNDDDSFYSITADPLADIKSIIDEEAKKILENQESEEDDSDEEEDEDNDDD